MKVLLVSSLSVFLLAGCDNFQLLKPLSSNQTLDINNKTQKNTFDNKPQAGDQNTSHAPAIRTGPVEVPAAGESTSTQPADQSNEPLIIPPRASTSTTTTTKTATAANATNDKDKSQQASTDVADTAPATTQATGKNSDKNSDSKKSNNEGTQTNTAKAAAAATGSTQEKPAASSIPAASSTDGTNVISVVEHLNIAAVLNKTFASNYMSMTKPVLPANTQEADFKTKFTGSIDKFTYSVLNKDQMLVEFKDVTISVNGQLPFTQEGYELAAVCVGAKCDILFVTISKFDEKRKVLENYPVFLKLVQGEYQRAVFKKKEEYEADRNAVSNQNSIKLVPQLAVTQKLHKHMEAHGGQLVELLREQLKTHPALVYSNHVIGHPSMNTKKFIPRFSREEGKLMVTAQLEYFSPKTPLLFKGEVKADTVSGPISSPTGLSMYIFPQVKNEIYLLLMQQSQYKSKIANVEDAVQAVICSVLEEANNQFSDCMTLDASIVFGEDKVVEGSSQEKIKAAAQ